MSNVRMFASRLFLGVVIFAVTLTSTENCFAEDYPEKPVRVVVGVATGTAGDVTARVVADALSRKLGKQFVVDNRPGANGAIGAETVASSPADGYTLFFTASSPMTITPHTIKGLHWDPLKSFTPVVEVGTTPLAIAVSKRSSIKSISDLIAAARKNPDTVKIGVLSLSMSQLAVAMLESSEHVRFRLVPYKGTTEMLTGVLSNEIDVAVLGVGGLTGQLGSGGGLNSLAVTTAQKLQLLPDSPPVNTVVPGYDIGSWFGIFAPAGTNAKVVQLLNNAVNSLIRTPTMQASLESLGTIVTGGEPAALQKRLASDYQRFGQLMQKDKAGNP